MRFSWPFGRQARGRHALGAAVTGIPSAPVRVARTAEPLPAAAPPVRASPPATPWEVVVPISPSPLVREVVPAPAVPLTAPPAVPAQPMDLVADLFGFGAPSGPPVEARLPVQPAAVPPVEATVAAAVPARWAGPRVELGFADGSSRVLDPESAAAQQLRDLVAQLTGTSSSTSATAS